MDIKDEFQLGEFSFIGAVNEDFLRKIQLDNDKEQLIEYDLQNILDVTEVFNRERQSTDIYQIYGGLEYLSILNQTKLNYTQLSDFFLQTGTTNLKNVFNDFKFYLLKPSTGFTALTTGSTGGTYVRNYQVVGEAESFEIFNGGFSVNLYDEQKYSWNFNRDFNLQNQFDAFNFPITQLFLYAVYQPKTNGDGDLETMERKSYNSTGGTVITGFTPTALTSGDTVIGDVIVYDKDDFLQTVTNPQEYYIYTPYNNGNNSLKWKYSPIITLQVLVFEDEVERVNISGTSVEDIASVPSYATPIDNQGNVVWRNILDRGFLDPLTGDGVNYPFVNQKQYVFNNIILSVVPDLTDSNTNTVFTQIKFGADTFLSAQPTSSLTDINKPC